VGRGCFEGKTAATVGFNFESCQRLITIALGILSHFVAYKSAVRERCVAVCVMSRFTTIRSLVLESLSFFHSLGNHDCEARGSLKITQRKPRKSLIQPPYFPKMLEVCSRMHDKYLNKNPKPNHVFPKNGVAPKLPRAMRVDPTP